MQEAFESLTILPTAPTMPDAALNCIPCFPSLYLNHSHPHGAF
ncbi:MAG: hypothetical protein ACK5RJ_03320 [Burkholderiales bacterium]